MTSDATPAPLVDATVAPDADRATPRAIVESRARRDASALLDSAGLVLIDLDGCLAFANVPHPAARALLDRLAGRYAILSNNSTQTPQGLADILAANGLAVDPERILLAGSMMVDVLAAEYAGRRICLLANEAILAHARESRLRLARDDAEVVALTRDPTLTHAKLSYALESLHRGAALVASNPDTTHPGPGYVPVLETGAILAIFRACMPTLDCRVIGKPGKIMFEAALQRFGCSAERAVMIGDNPQTDGAGARNCGIAPILLGPDQALANIAELV
ncbi:MAG: HAD hydrolase-like protein [Burkholderiales bacterium]|nr:HAD hydrolase-like protein [Burkholderiales bacterium]